MDNLNPKEESNMLGTVFAAFVALALAGAGLALLVWWLWLLWKRREEEAVVTRAVEAIEIKAEAPPAEVAEADVELEEPVEEIEPPAADNLKRIEGIGPKIESVLQAGGIATYAQLADAEADQITEILREADPRLLRLASPDTWSEQAKLAADGDWDGLAALQGGLKGGRRA